MSTKHTPTPWIYERTDRDFSLKGDVGHFYNVGGVCNFNERPENEANAAFIVRACNAHDELVAAADEALNTLIGCCIPAGGCDDRKAILDTQMRLRKILSAVGVNYSGEALA